MRPVTVRVPATSANLGPGYDSFGLALALWDTYTAVPAEKWCVDIVGEGEERFARDGRNRVAKAMAAVFEQVEGAPKAAHITCENRIPSARGLGSSAAAVTGGVLLADALCGGVLPKERLFEIAARFEGHPDNVAPAIYGGFTIAWADEGGPKAATLRPGRGLAAIAVVSRERLRTDASRGLVPTQVPHADAAFGAARAGLLASGLILGRADLIAAGLHDRIHQQYRASAVPDMERVIESLVRAGALGAVLSGAGPTVIGLVTAEDDAAALASAGKAAARMGPMPDGRLEPLVLGIDHAGAQVSRG
ncbi:MAG: homoserine kinase [Actinobacteria bacterium]|nr:homoserine kinase [Actinomycetota bacterium]